MVYQTVEEDGKSYYEIPTSQIEMKTNIQEDGVVVKRNYEGAVKRKMSKEKGGFHPVLQIVVNLIMNLIHYSLLVG